MSRIVVTGGAGFIGSHTADALVGAGHEVVVVDDLSSGKKGVVPKGAQFVRGDVRAVADDVLPEADAVWHLAANPEVRTGETDPAAHYEQNVGVTWELLEAMRRHDVGRLVFTSTSTVYGEAKVRPTPEDYGPLLPISVYGGAKLACEALISSFAGTFGLDALLFRFANVVGPRSTHGVTYDFVKRLRQDPDRLEILGDGTQTKSYVHVADTVAGMLHADDRRLSGVHAFNLGSEDAIPVTRIADIVSRVLDIEPEYAFTGGTATGAGWKGDVKNMGLAIGAMKRLGWRPTMTSAEAIEDTARWLATDVFPA